MDTAGWKEFYLGKIFDIKKGKHRCTRGTNKIK